MKADTFPTWLASLQWDGQPRLMTWLHRTLHRHVRPTSSRYHHYLRLVGRHIVLGHVARALDPGCKFDHSVVLIGPQGGGKSQLIRTLVGSEQFADGHPDMLRECPPGVHAYEVPELAAFSTQENAQLKTFLAAQADRYRAPYAEQEELHPRPFLVWCTTNSEELPPEFCSGRRLWPVYVHKASMRWLEHHREQVFAEAVHMHLKGARLSPSAHQVAAYIGPECARLAAREAAA